MRKTLGTTRKVPVTMTIEISIIEAIDILAEEEGRTRSNYVSHLLSNHIKNQQAQG